MPVTGIGGGPSRLYGPVGCPTANATVFTAQVPTILRDLKVANTGASSTSLVLGINSSVVAAQLVPVGSSVAGSALVTFALDTPLNAGDTVQVIGPSTITLTLTGEIAGQGAA